MNIIANPNAGHGSGRRQLRDLQASLQETGVRYEFLETRYPGHAEEIARGLRGECKRLVVFGGDGTVSEVVNGMRLDETELGIIPVGTGNDLARSLKLPINQPRKALRVILHGTTRRIDLGVAGERRFVSTLGVGFPVLVAAEANQLKRWKGPTAFALAVCKAVRHLKYYPVRIVLDNVVVRGRKSTVLLQNTPYTGGGLLMAPGARLDDGLLDVVIVGDIGKLNLMLNFPRLYQGGHLTHSKFKLYRSRTVRIESEKVLPRMMDGEIAGKTPVNVRVEPHALRVRVGYD